jgi:adenosylmethionine---8-amino-7-oxononanoate aminotransferase
MSSAKQQDVWKHPLQQHLWRPYAQMQTAPLPQKVIRTEGSRLFLEEGRVLIDGIASWWTACHGYNHPHIIQAVEKQLKTMPHVMFGGLVHDPAIRLADKLVSITPRGLERVFFSDSGSTSVEVAMKMALQYWQNKGQAKKDRFVCFRGGYHGDTMGAMSVSDPEDSMHKAFRSNVMKQYVLDIPMDEYGLAEFQEMMQGIGRMVAGVIIEPLIQGAEGMRFHSPDVLAAIHRAAKENDVLFIADEVAVGFGRTGSLFACEEAGISPDIMCLGKGLTGGVVPLAATMATEEIFSAFLDERADKALMHGPTFMANPLGCVAALASLELFDMEDRLGQVEAIETQLREQLAPCRRIDGVRDVRVKGATGVVELEETLPDKYWLNQRFIEEGVWIRPIKNVVYVMPAMTISPDELATLTGAIQRVITEYLQR